MSVEELRQFYEAALAGGSILSGFIATFLTFRIQREANYYRQPVLDFNGVQEHGAGKDAYIGKSHFPASLMLIICSWFGSTFFGVLWPLSALAHWTPAMTTPAPILAGIVSSIFLVAAYFLAEMVHYNMLRCKAFEFDRKEWGLAIGCLLLVTPLLGFVTYSATRLPTNFSETPPALPAGLSDTPPPPAGATRILAGTDASQPCFVPEIALLRNGFSIRHGGRQIIGNVTRLYLTKDCSFIDIPTAEIDHFESDPNTEGKAH